MKHHRLLAMLLLGSLLTAGSCGFGAAQERAASGLPDNAAELDALLDRKEYLKLTQMMRGVNQGEIVLLNMNWSRQKMLAGRTAFVNYLYLYDLYRVMGHPSASGLKKTAVMVGLYTYELIHIDGAKCEDRSAPEHRRDQLFSNYPKVWKEVPNFSEADREAMIRTALGLEARTAAGRADDEFLCRDGMAEYSASFKKFGDNAGREVPTPPGGYGKTIVIETDPDYRPAFRKKQEWLPEQEKLRSAMPSMLAKVIEAAGQAK